jgi:hypothetical protein
LEVTILAGGSHSLDQRVEKGFFEDHFVTR